MRHTHLVNHLDNPTPRDEPGHYIVLLFFPGPKPVTSTYSAYGLLTPRRHAKILQECSCMSGS